MGCEKGAGSTQQSSTEVQAMGSTQEKWQRCGTCESQSQRGPMERSARKSSSLPGAQRPAARSRTQPGTYWQSASTATTGCLGPGLSEQRFSKQTQVPVGGDDSSQPAGGGRLAAATQRCGLHRSAKAQSASAAQGAFGSTAGGAVAATGAASAGVAAGGGAVAVGSVRGVAPVSGLPRQDSARSGRSQIAGRTVRR